MNQFTPSATAPSGDAPDPLHRETTEDAFWTTTNVGEAIPGVATPLTASLWADNCALGLLETAVAIGAFNKREATTDAAREMFGFFYGRAALRVEVFALLGDRLPGSSGPEFVTAILGRVPEGMRFQPTRSRYLLVAAKFPRTFVFLPRRMRRTTAEFDRWWRRSVDRAAGLDLHEARSLLRDADRRMREAVVLQAAFVMSCVSPVHDAVARLIKQSGSDDLSVLLSPVGGAEMAVIQDLWAASRGEITTAQVIADHGFHGPGEGELANRVWREDPDPVYTIVEQYRDRDDTQKPGVRERSLRADRDRAEAELLARTPRHRRPAVRLVLSLARTRLPLRGVAKRAILQSLDVTRIAARRIGRHLVDTGALEQVDHVYFLTKQELLADRHTPLTDLVACRRGQRDYYRSLAVPSSWQGSLPATPQPRPDSADPVADADVVVSGIGVSAGVVEGACRVVLDPVFAEVESDEILVAPTTDPSWSSIMFVAAGLIVDIGGALSHAAVVARELGLPCVVNTGNGSSVLKTGDRVRMDGTTGIVERLPAAEPAVP
jgi:pyruvate,water dikinase